MKDTENAPTFRKTKSGKWAVMGPVEVLQKAIDENEGKVDVLKKSGDWSSYTVVSLGSPFDVEGKQMCYGYDTADEETDSPAKPKQTGSEPVVDLTKAPVTDSSEPMPEFQGGSDAGWDSAG